MVRSFSNAYKTVPKAHLILMIWLTLLSANRGRIILPGWIIENFLEYGNLGGRQLLGVTNGKGNVNIVGNGNKTYFQFVGLHLMFVEVVD